MIGRYAVLSQRIRQVLAEIVEVVARVERTMSRRQPETIEDDVFLDAAALNLHAFYTGLERIFRQIAAEIDGSVPSGTDWHRILMKQMTTDLPGVRPAVLSAGTALSLDEFLRFRHVVRNGYALKLDPERVERLVARVPPAFATARIEILCFADVLDQLAQAS